MLKTIELYIHFIYIYIYIYIYFYYSPINCIICQSRASFQQLHSLDHGCIMMWLIGKQGDQRYGQRWHHTAYATAKQSSNSVAVCKASSVLLPLPEILTFVKIGPTSGGALFPGLNSQWLYPESHWQLVTVTPAQPSLRPCWALPIVKIIL